MRKQNWLWGAALAALAGCSDDHGPPDVPSEQSSRQEEMATACEAGSERCDGSTLSTCAEDGTSFEFVADDSPACAERVDKQVTWPRNIGSCADRTSPPRDLSGYHRAEHIGTCVLPDKLPIVYQVIDGGSGALGNMCQQSITAALNSVRSQVGSPIAFVAGNGSSPHPNDITFDCNTGAAPLAVTITTQNAVSIDPWNGPRRLGLRSDIFLNSQGISDHYELHKQRTGGTPACINMSRAELFHSIVLHEVLHALGFSHDNYNAGVNLLTIMHPTGAIPTRIPDATCNAGTEPGFRVAWINHVDQRYIDPVFRDMLQAYYVNNSLLPE
jgi:hypothetical protein